MVNLAKNARLRARTKCKKFSVLLMDSMATGIRMTGFRIPCKSWSCARCAKKKADDYGKRAEAGLIDSRVRLLTLTIKPQESLPGALRCVSRGWNRLNGKIKRKYGKYKYFKVIERQPGTGMPHFHLLIDIYIDKAWLVEAAVLSGFGQICDIREVKSHAVFHYVLKYLKKGINNDIFDSALLTLNTRRVSFSRDFCVPIRKKLSAVVCWFGRSSWASYNSAAFHLLYPDSNWHRAIPLVSSNTWVDWFLPQSHILRLAPP